MKKTQGERLLRLARQHGVVTARVAAQHGIHSQRLTRMVRSGKVERIARGQYRFIGGEVSAHHSLALVSRAVPGGVICLLSALRFHELTTQNPFEVWVAIDRRSRRPSLRYPRLRVVRFTGGALTDGVETHRIEGHPVHIYGVAKTLADLFKYRNKVGLDVALEALREAWRDRRFTMGELDRHAKTCRVERVMRPYIEALVA